MGIILVMMVIFLIMGMFGLGRHCAVGDARLLPIVMKLPVEELGFIGELEPRQVAVWFGVLLV